MKKDIYILGIESSCDETAAAILLNGREIKSSIISSQISIHKKYGGVVPEIASRNHVKDISHVVSKAMEVAKLEFNQLDGIAVTYGPGLVGALLVGVSYAKSLSYSTKIPLIPVHHIEGHICSNYLENDDFKPPYMCLVVSGGHTNLVSVKDYGEYEIIGKTRDDAVGEAYDKVARTLGLPYPGGPEIDKLAQLGNPFAIDFPRVFLEANTYDFSFSGIKSSVLNYVNNCKMQNLELKKEDIASSFQQAVIEVLVTKTINACKEYGYKNIAMAGGVSCNMGLRKYMSEKCEENGFTIKLPKAIHCTDNAAMIASSGYYNFCQGRRGKLDLNAYPALKLGDIF